MNHNITFATWNVNSIRARYNNISDALKETKIDVIMLQETKVQDKDFPLELIYSLGYNIAFYGQKSYNGVAILSKFPFESEVKSLPIYEYGEIDLEARFIQVSITFQGNVITFASVYVPNGASVDLKIPLESSSRFVYKLNFFKRLTRYIKENFDLENDYLVFGGDYNVANDEIDLFNPKAAAGNVGFHDSERKLLKDLLSIGMIDMFRALHPTDRQYSWWDYRTSAHIRDNGWRIDYLLASKNIMKKTIECRILKHLRGLEKASDHTIVLGEVVF
jgi:exodeoxyribonuclease-3